MNDRIAELSATLTRAMCVLLQSADLKSKVGPDWATRIAAWAKAWAETECVHHAWNVPDTRFAWVYAGRMLRKDCSPRYSTAVEECHRAYMSMAEAALEPIKK
jgi:hypothetical protein